MERARLPAKINEVSLHNHSPAAALLVQGTAPAVEQVPIP